MKSKAIRETRQMAFDELYDCSQTEASFAIDDSFPEKLADELSRREVFNKHLFRPNTYLHKWWARRCGSTFRAILKQFVPNVERRGYYAPGGLEGKVVLDPMMGGGTTLHEAIRLGANVIGVDIDPIPIIQARASLTQITLEELQAAFSRFFGDLYQQVGHYFQTECPVCGRTVDSHFTLYGLRKSCGCGAVIQIDQYELREEADRSLRIWPESWEISYGQTGLRPDTSKPRLITKGEAVCSTCGQKYREMLDTPYYARYMPFAVTGVCPEHGLFFSPPRQADLDRIHEADAHRQILDFGPRENFAVKNGPKSGDLLAHNISSYLDVFSSRQLLFLCHAIECLRDCEGPTKLNLALLVSTSLEFNALLCGYKGWFKRRPGAIRHVFALHAYSLPYTALENNPVNRGYSSGNLQLLFRDRIVRGRKWAAAPIERKVDRKGETHVVTIRGEIDGGIEIDKQTELEKNQRAFWLIHRDSRDLPVADESVDFIVTDPPYYDSVQYSDLAAFFRVWLRQLLPSDINWTYDEERSAVAARVTENGTLFAEALTSIFRECGRVLKHGMGRMVFTFHHWDANAWAELTIALKSAGFKLINYYVVFSEHPISVHINKLNSIKHDTILVFARDGDMPVAQWHSLRSIDMRDSEEFCRQCGAALGWLLESDLSPAEIRDVWKQLVQGGKSNGAKRKQPAGGDIRISDW